jgi:four helix bundle protein
MSRKQPHLVPVHQTDRQPVSERSYPFSHKRLEVYQVALEMARRASALADRVPRGFRSTAEHLKRSAGQAVLLIGEGAHRYSSGQKRQRYTEARGECGEVATATELLCTLSLVPPAEAAHVEHLAGRTAAMLTRLIHRYR